MQLKICGTFWSQAIRCDAYSQSSYGSCGYIHGEVTGVRLIHSQETGVRLTQSYVMRVMLTHSQATNVQRNQGYKAYLQFGVRLTYSQNSL